MTTYLRVALPVEPADILALQQADLVARTPGWVGAAGNLDESLLEVSSQQLATLNEVAGSVQDTIYRDLLSSLFGIPPLDATFATATSTWTMKDAAGYTIPANTEVAIPVAGDQSVGFKVLADVVVPPGSTVTTAGQVQLVALVAGAAGSGLGGIATIVTPIVGPTLVTFVGVSTGGQDAESDSDFLTRGKQRLQRLTFGLVLPADVAAAVREVAGVERVLVIDNYVPGVDELQDLAVTSATGGTFTATFNAVTTGAIAFNATAAAFRAALEVISTVGVGNVICTGGPLGTAPIRTQFTNLRGRQNVSQMTTTSSLTGVGAAATVTTVLGGVAPDPNSAGSLTVIPIDAVGQPVPAGVLTAVTTLLAASLEQGFAIGTRAPLYTSITAAFTATAYPGFDPVVVQAAAIAALGAYLSPATWGQPGFGDQSVWIEDLTVRFGECYAVLNQVLGLNHVLTLTLNGLSNTDIALTGPGGMPTSVGLVTGTVT